MHIEAPPPQGWLQAAAELAQLPGACIKTVSNVQAAAEARAAAGAGATVVLRHWYDPGQTFNGSAAWQDYADSARRFFDSFIDGTFLEGATAGIAHWQAVDLIEGWNEFNANSHTPEEVATRVASVEARAREWQRRRQADSRLAHIRLVIGNVAIGNDVPAAYARIASQYDCVLGYHSYVPVAAPGAARPEALQKAASGANMRQAPLYAPQAGYRLPAAAEAAPSSGWRRYILPGEWQHYSGRWAMLDAQFVRAGYAVDWIFTEAGPVGYGLAASGAVFLRAYDGWLSPLVYGGQLDGLLDCLAYWLENAAATPAWRQGRVLGHVGALFTSSARADSWPSFQLRQPALGAVCQWLAGQPAPPAPPPAPDPGPGPGRQYNRHYDLLPQDATLAERLAVARLAHGTLGTVGHSADDAAVLAPELAQRRVRVWDVDRVAVGGREALESWWRQHYSMPEAVEYRQLAELVQ